MIGFFQNLRIGTKLGLASGLGVIMVGLMILNQLVGNGTVNGTHDSALREADIARAAIDAKASTRGLQISALNVRFANTADDLQKAKDFLAQRLKSFTTSADDIIRLSSSQATRAEVEKLKGLTLDYEKAAQQIATIKNELLEIAEVEASGMALSTDAQARVGTLNDNARQIAGKVMQPLAEQLEQGANAIVERAKQTMTEEVAKATQQSASVNRTALAIGAVSTLLLVGTSLLSIFMIARPMRHLTGAMQELAEGNFDVELPGIGRKDEIGAVSQAVANFKLKAEEKARLESENKHRQDQAAAEQRKSEMIRLADAFEGAVGDIVKTVSSASGELETSAGGLAHTAERAQSTTAAVAAASDEASSNVQSVATATEELSSSINEISRQVQDSARMATDAVGQARITTDRVSELSKAASRIGDVVELINTIAGQTNLLALNATIEAARAGDAGRGFAVVASEVKALAEQTAKATGEIGQQIAAIQSATEESVDAIKQISSTIERLSEISATIASAVEEQGAATQEISRNVQQAAHGTQEVSSKISDVRRGATETGSASSQLLAAAQSLSGESSRLRDEVGRFLESVRAA